MPVLEPEIAAHSIKGFFHSCRNAGEGCTVLILLVLPIVVVETHPDGSVVTRTGWTCRLDGISAFPVALQIELLRDANVNVLGTANDISRVISVDDGNGPIEVSVVGSSAEFNAALGRTEDHGIIGRARQNSDARFAVNVIRRQVDGLRLRERQIQLELSESYVQCIFR